MAKKTSFVPDFGPFGLNSGSQHFFLHIWLRQSLDIMVIYHDVRYKNLKRTDESDFIGRFRLLKLRCISQI